MVQLSVGKAQQKQVVAMYRGNKQKPGVQNARRIASELSIPRRQVMTILKQEGLASYSEKSFR
jgi:hypothetical protein